MYIDHDDQLSNNVNIIPRVFKDNVTYGYGKYCTIVCQSTAQIITSTLQIDLLQLFFFYFFFLFCLFHVCNNVVYVSVENYVLCTRLKSNLFCSVLFCSKLT